MAGREVTLVLCTADGDLLGASAPFRLAVDGDRDVEDVVEAASRTLRVRVRVLRLLDAPDELLDSGDHAITYLAEVDALPDAALTPWPGDPLASHPHRQPYAEPGAHQRDLDWAATALTDLGISLVAAPIQVRTWCLSSIWRLPSSAGVVWLKVAPRFCGSEAAIMPLVDERVVPRVLAAAPDRVLLADVAGEDQYEASLEEVAAMVRMLVELQADWIGRDSELENLGLIDNRAAAATPRIESVVDRNRHLLDAGEQRELDLIVDGLAERFADLEACGIPDTLVHGDFYPGNVRGTPGAYRILDWGSSGIGHPMLDLRPTFERWGQAEQLERMELWAREWSRVLPGCEALRAAELARPLGPLMGAVGYQMFLDNSEPSDRPYFEGDAVEALHKACTPAP